ncbi:MAG: MEMO1 family protein [Candidatus Magasanikbacteria bacterium]|nr:MEMO1 family protein [Candidatus Magasanikbacteria bacterium]
MSLVFAAITPHPPLLIPAIGKENIKKIDATKKALEKMEEYLYLSHPDIVLLISPHGKLFDNAFSMNVCAEYETDLKEFGDLTTKLHFKGELNLPALIREASKKKEYRTIMISEKKLDHGAAVPLFYLTPHLPDISLTIFGFCNLDAKTHTDFGYLIKEQIMRTNKRVAVIASGDLSHALTTDAPAGFNPEGAVFDKKIQEYLATRNTAGLLQMEAMIANAAECGFRSFLILMGILRGVNYTFESYAYEGPFGVGYLTANFVL